MSAARRAPRGRLTNAKLAGLAALHGTPLLVIDCATIRRQYRSLADALPGVGLFDHALYPVDCLGGKGARHPSVLAGPTCDSIDVIREDLPLPELGVGDLVVGRMMGAYTAASASDFNFIPRATIVSVNQRQAGSHAD